MNKYSIKKEYNKNTNKKLFKILLIITILSLLFGILYVAIISNSNKILIKNSFNSYFNQINTNSYNYINNLINNLLTNILLTIIIWILGISIIGIPISIIYLSYKSFVLSFSITSILYIYKLKGIIPMIIYTIPSLINLVVIFILTFYAVQISKKLYLFLFRKKDFNIKYMINKYYKLLLIVIIILLITSLTSTYLVPMLLKSFTNALI